MALPNVCVVSTIRFAGTTFETQFKAGLGTIPGTYKAPIDNQGYDIQTLITAAQNAAKNNTLVVAVGGLITGQAALQAKVSFIALTGGIVNFIDATTNTFLGGICLDSYKYDPGRITYLTTKVPCSANQICLLYNTHSAMASIEKQQFTYSQNADIDQTNVNNANAIYTTAFNAIGKLPNIKAVVVSADPFFGQTKDQLTSVAQNYPYYITYPLKGYKNANPRPKHNHSTIHAPKDDLATVYWKLGKKAGDIANGKTAAWDHEGPLDTPDDQ
jgi:hypothetical protein